MVLNDKKVWYQSKMMLCKNKKRPWQNIKYFLKNILRNLEYLKKKHLVEEEIKCC